MKRALVDKMMWCNRGWQPVFFGFCPSERVWKKEMIRLGVPGTLYPVGDAHCTYFQEKKLQKTCCIITMSDKPGTGFQKVAMLAHEGMHVWRKMRKVIGETKPSAEFEAYSVQCILQELIEAFEATRGRLTMKRVR